MKLYVESYGCQMNVLDTELLVGSLARRGYELTDKDSEADVILVDTCSVREHAEDRVFSNVGAMKKLKRRKPSLIIGLVGCMAQNWTDKIFERLPHVDLVAGPRFLAKVPDALEEIRRTGLKRLLTQEQDFEFLTDTHFDGARAARFKAYVKVVEGCDMPCTYCIVPRVRGGEISRPIPSIVEEVRKLVDSGVAEVTLLGQTVDAYGRFLRPAVTLADLLHEVSKVAGLKRLAFITSHPLFARRNLFEAMRDIPICMKYMHMPAQSGSTSILNRMKRGYTREKYFEIVQMAREIVPDIAIASDFIVGFPGETDTEFQESVTLMQECRFSNSFVFKYSPRPGTEGIKMQDDVPIEVKKERNQRLLEVQNKISAEDNKKYEGRDVSVLIEGITPRDDRKIQGRDMRNRICIFDKSATGCGGSAASAGCGTQGGNGSTHAGEFVTGVVTSTTALAFYCKGR